MYRAFQCNVCKTPLAVGRRIDYRYCGVRCRVKAHRIRYDGRGLLDVEYHHIIERIIRVAVPANDTQLPAEPDAGNPASPEKQRDEAQRESASTTDQEMLAQENPDQGGAPSIVAEPVEGSPHAPVAGAADVPSVPIVSPTAHVADLRVQGIEHAPGFRESAQQREPDNVLEHAEPPSTGPTLKSTEPVDQTSKGLTLEPRLEASRSEPLVEDFEKAGPHSAATASISPAGVPTGRELAESEQRVSTLKEQLRRAEDEASRREAHEATLVREKATLQQQLEATSQALETAQASVDASKAQLAAKAREHELAVLAAIEYKQRLNEVRKRLAKREAELALALEQAEELSQARSRRQSMPPQTGAFPSASQDAELRQRRQIAELSAQVQGLTEQLALAQADQAALKQCREEGARLASAEGARRKELREVAAERDALHLECTNLIQQVDQLTHKLRRYEDGTWHAVASGVVGVAAEVAHAYAEKEGLKLPPLTTPTAKPAPPASPPAPPAPPPEDPETKRWREVIAEQKRRGWDPRSDLLVTYKLDELKEEDELARAQEKAGVPITARKLLPTTDANVLSQRAALEARVEHHRAHCNAKSFFDRARWDKEHYRLDVLSEGKLQRASMDRASQLQGDLDELRSRRS